MTELAAETLLDIVLALLGAGAFGFAFGFGFWGAFALWEKFRMRILEWL